MLETIDEGSLMGANDDALPLAGTGAGAAPAAAAAAAAAAGSAQAVGDAGKEPVKTPGPSTILK